MRSQALHRGERGRILALTTVLAVALALIAPATADAWTQNRSDGANTSRADSDGPSDPGLAWRTDVRELASDAAPDGYVIGADIERFGDLNRPLLTDDGTLILRARIAEGTYSLIALDPEDGTLRWEAADVGSSCGQSIDSQGRLWVATNADSSLIRALDTDTGEVLADTEFELDVSCISTSLHIGGDTETLVVPRPGSLGFQAVDISGAAPEAAWTIDLDATDSPFEAVIGPTDQSRRVAMTDTSVVVPVRTDDGPQLLELALDDGAVRARTDLPVPVGGDATDIGAVHLLVEDDALVVGVRERTGRGGDGYVAGYDLATGLTQGWLEATEDGRGPNQLTLGSSGAFHYNPGDGTVRARALADGALRWSGVDILVGGAVTYGAAADAGGVVYTFTSTNRPEGTGGHAITAISDDGDILWQATRAAIADAAGIATAELADTFVVGPVRQGTLYLTSGPEIIAIDSSGGLALEEPCELPFGDVREGSTHADNICRLVELEITGGTSDTTYSPRRDVTRAQMASFLARALDLDPIADPGGDAFPDVNPEGTHAGNINAIRAAGITQGLGDGTYDPSGSVTRAQMASFLANAAGLDPVPGGSTFTDVDPENVHTPRIYAVLEAGITTGTSASTFNPNTEVRRDQMASFIIRLVDYLDEQD